LAWTGCFGWTIIRYVEHRVDGKKDGAPETSINLERGET
jgi:hypothetical protein